MQTVAALDADSKLVGVLMTKRKSSQFDLAPPIDGQITWRGPLEGSLKQLADWSTIECRNFEKRHGKSLWLQKLQKGKYRLWFASQADFANAVGRKESTPTSKNAHKQARTRASSQQRPRK